MKDSKEIVLFFKENTHYSALDVAKEISERYPLIGEPIILRETENRNAPLVIFNTNKDLQMQGTLNSFTIVMNHTHFDDITKIVFDIVDCFDSFSCEFVRIGYLANVFLSPKYVKVAKEKYLKMENLSDISDVNLSWYKLLQAKFGSINCWERIITDERNFKDLLCQYDFNTLIGEVVELDMKNIKEFFNITNKYISDRVDF